MPALSPEKILKLKGDPTDANVKQIEDKEKSVAEKKIVLDKHCCHFGSEYGKSGTEENEVMSDTTSSEVSVVLTSICISIDVSFQAGAVTNGNVEHVPASTKINMSAASAVTFDAAADTAVSAALDEFQSP